MRVEKEVFENQENFLLVPGSDDAIGVALFVPPDSQQRRSLGNALFKEQVTAEGQTAFDKGRWRGGTLAQAGLQVEFYSMPQSPYFENKGRDMVEISP